MIPMLHTCSGKTNYAFVGKCEFQDSKAEILRENEDHLQDAFPYVWQILVGSSYLKNLKKHCIHHIRVIILQEDIVNNAV